MPLEGKGSMSAAKFSKSSHSGPVLVPKGAVDDEMSVMARVAPLTGRDTEVNLLMDRWEQANEGMGQVVLLIGEAGLGKSRLVHTLKEHVLGQMLEGEVDSPVIEWRCSPHFQYTGLHPSAQSPRGVRPCPAGNFASVGVAAGIANLRPLRAAFFVSDPAEGRNVPGHAGMAAHPRGTEAGPFRR
jgi:hypothetical protein